MGVVVDVELDSVVVVVVVVGVVDDAFGVASCIVVVVELGNRRPDYLHNSSEIRQNSADIVAVTTFDYTVQPVAVVVMVLPPFEPFDDRNRRNSTENC